MRLHHQRARSDPGRAFLSGFFGAALMETLGNMQVGGAAGPNAIVSYRFKAAVTSALNSIRFYTVTGGGYSGGTLGTFNITVQTDNGSGMPSGVVLAAANGIVPDATASGTGQLVTWGAPAALTAGTTYHIVFTNGDGAPTVNFASVDLAFVYGAARNPLQPGIDPSGVFAACRNINGGGWAKVDNYTPIMDLAYASGTHQGMGYMEANVAAGNFAAVGGLGQARQVIRNGGADKILTAAYMGVRRVSGADPITLSVKNGAGTVLATAATPAASVPVSAPDNAGTAYAGGVLSSQVPFPASATLYLVLSAPGTSAYTAEPSRAGIDYGYSPATWYGTFPTVEAQKSADGGGTWASCGRVADENDFQFYCNFLY